ncbi:hypothetical protein X975_11850, partial [Stegodyphus mimosarum]
MHFTGPASLNLYLKLIMYIINYLCQGQENPSHKKACFYQNFVLESYFTVICKQIVYYVF